MNSIFIKNSKKIEINRISCLQKLLFRTTHRTSRRTKYACSVCLELYNNLHHKVNSIPKYTTHSTTRFMIICKQMNTSWQAPLSLQHNEVRAYKKEDKALQVELKQTSKWVPKGMQYLFSNALLLVVIFQLKHA